MNNAHRLVDVDLNLLVTFAAVLQERSARRAAARLGVTPSAVSHALARLRVQLGDDLFVSTPRGMVPTARAERMAEPVARALESLGAALGDEARFDPAAAQRTFTMCSADLGEFVLLPSLCEELARSAPGVRLEVKAPPDDPYEQLERGVLDLAITVQLDAPAAFRAQPLVRERFICVVRKGHPKVRGPLTLERYCALTHVSIAPRGRPGTLVDDVLARLGARRHVAVVVPHFLVAPYLVATTDHALMLPERIARRFAKLLPLRLLAPPPELELAGFTVAQLWHERTQNDPAHAWLRQALARAAHRL